MGLQMQSSAKFLSHLSNPCHHLSITNKSHKLEQHWAKEGILPGSTNSRKKIAVPFFHALQASHAFRNVCVSHLYETVHQSCKQPLKWSSENRDQAGKGGSSPTEPSHCPSCRLVDPLNPKYLIRDFSTSLTIISDRSTSFSLWISYKHCAEGDKSLHSCLINTGYAFKINIPSHPAAESGVSLISLQWEFKSDSEALSEAGGIWKTNSFVLLLCSFWLTGLCMQKLCCQKCFTFITSAKSVSRAASQIAKLAVCWGRFIGLLIWTGWS